MKKIKYILLTLGIVAGFGLAVIPSTVSAGAFDACPAGSDSTVCKGQNDDIMGFVKTAVNTLLYAVGIISVIMIIVAGMSYVTSAGDSAKVTKAKNTLLYSVIGLVVALLAYAIVNFVLRLL